MIDAILFALIVLLLLTELVLATVAVALECTESGRGGGWPFFRYQNIALVCMVLGWFILLPLALTGQWAWSYDRNVSVWRRRWIDDIWGNAEDGVDPGKKLVVDGKSMYLPGSPAWLRVYLWTAWRNSCNNLRWTYKVPGGPFHRWLLRGGTWYLQAGYRPDNGWPVFSAGTVNGPFGY